MQSSKEEQGEIRKPSSADMSLIPGLGRSPGEGNASHSSILTWEIPWTEEPGGLQSMELKEPGTTERLNNQPTPEQQMLVAQTREGMVEVVEREKASKQASKCSCPNVSNSLQPNGL